MFLALVLIIMLSVQTAFAPDKKPKLARSDDQSIGQ